jgi:hypothetical protein
MKIFDFFAASSGKINPGDIGITDPITDADAALVGILEAVYLWSGMLAVVIIIVAGYIYVISDGNATRIKRARDAIIGAAVGLVFIIMAFAITQFVLGRF